MAASVPKEGPDIICVRLEPSGMIDGEYARLPDMVNSKPAYRREANQDGGPFFLLFSDTRRWVIQASRRSDHIDNAYVICKDSAPHPGAVSKLWQTACEDNMQYVDDPTVKVWAKGSGQSQHQMQPLVKEKVKPKAQAQKDIKKPKQSKPQATGGTASQLSAAMGDTTSQRSMATEATAPQQSVVTEGTASQLSADTEGIDSQLSAATEGTDSQLSASTVGTDSELSVLDSVATGGLLSQQFGEVGGTTSNFSMAAVGTTSQLSIATAGMSSQLSVAGIVSQQFGEPIPHAVRVEMDPPGELDGVYARLPQLINERPVYCKGADKSADEQIYLLLTDTGHWSLQLGVGTANLEESFAVCPDPAGHPGAVHKPWQTVSETTYDYEDDPSVKISAVEEHIPDVIEVREESGEVDGKYQRTPNLVNQRPVYKRYWAPNHSIDPFFIVFTYNGHWALQETAEGSTEEENQYIICRDNASHPCAVRTPWQSVSSETFEFVDDETIKIWVPHDHAHIHKDAGALHRLKESRHLEPTHHDFGSLSLDPVYPVSQPLGLISGDLSMSVPVAQREPDLLEVNWQAPISGIYERLEARVNGRPIYGTRGVTEEGDGPFYLMFRDEQKWVLQENLAQTPESTIFIIADDLAPHPAAVEAAWQTVSEESRSFEDDESVEIGVPPIPHSICLAMDPPSPVDGLYLRSSEKVNRRFVFERVGGAEVFDDDEMEGTFCFVFVESEMWVVQEYSGDKFDTDADKDADAVVVCMDCAAHPAAVEQPWLTVSEETGEFEEDPGVTVWEPHGKKGSLVLMSIMGR